MADCNPDPQNDSDYPSGSCAAGEAGSVDVYTTRQTPAPSSTRNSVHLLNSDALICLFSHLDKSTLITASLVCKSWKEVIYQPIFWRDCIPIINCETFNKDCAVSFHQRGINSVRYRSDEEDTPSEERISTLLENLRLCQVTTLILHELGLLTSVFRSLNINLPAVKCLVLEQDHAEKPSLPSDSEEMKSFMQPLANLEKLVVGFNDHSFCALSVTGDDRKSLYWKWVEIITSFLPRLTDLEVIHLRISQFIDDVPYTLSPMLSLRRLSLAQSNKYKENNCFAVEDGRAAMEDRSNFIMGHWPDGRPIGPHVSSIVIDFGLISKLYSNLRHLEFTVENHAKFKVPKETWLEHLVSLRLAGTNIRTTSNVIELINCCPNLLALDLKGAFIPHKNLTGIMQSCRQLEMLDLSFAGLDCEMFSVLKSVAANLPQLKVLITIGCVYPLKGAGVDIDIDSNSSLFRKDLKPGKEIVLNLLRQFSCLVSLLGIDEGWMNVNDFAHTSLNYVGIGNTSPVTLTTYPAQYRTTANHHTYRLERRGKWTVLEEGTKDWHTAWGTKYISLPGSKSTNDLLRDTTTDTQHIRRRRKKRVK